MRHYAPLLQVYPGETSKSVVEIMKQCNGSYTSDNPLKLTILTPQLGYLLSDCSLLSQELAIQLAKFPQVQVTVLVPENYCYEWEKREAASHGVTIIEAKKQPGFDDPVDWLSFPPQDLTTDIVVGMGERRGKIAQIFKKRHQCKSIYVVSNPFEDWSFCSQHLRNSLVRNRSLGLSLERNVGLSEMADLPVTIGPKTSEECSRRCPKKDFSS